MPIDHKAYIRDKTRIANQRLSEAKHLLETVTSRALTRATELIRLLSLLTELLLEIESALECVAKLMNQRTFVNGMSRIEKLWAEKGE